MLHPANVATPATAVFDVVPVQARVAPAGVGDRQRHRGDVARHRVPTGILNRDDRLRAERDATRRTARLGGERQLRRGTKRDRHRVGDGRGQGSVGRGQRVRALQVDVAAREGRDARNRSLRVGGAGQGRVGRSRDRQRDQARVTRGRVPDRVLHGDDRLGRECGPARSTDRLGRDGQLRGRAHRDRRPSH